MPLIMTLAIALAIAAIAPFTVTMLMRFARLRSLSA